MCARYVLEATEREILEAYAAEVTEPFQPTYNIAVTNESLVITADEPTIAQKMHFGVIPWNAPGIKDILFKYQTWNARSEEVLEKKMYKPLMEKGKRCLVLSSGFYEGKRTNPKTVIPYYFQVKGKPLYAYAGLWSKWVNPTTNVPYFSYNIMTTVANEMVSEVHDKKRMPVIMPNRELEKLWLDKSAPIEQLLRICNPYPDDLMTRHEVHTRANSVDRKDKPNNDPGLILPYENSL